MAVPGTVVSRGIISNRITRLRPLRFSHFPGWEFSIYAAPEIAQNTNECSAEMKVFGLSGYSREVAE
ncbi:hypothetical protein [Streptomyces sp. AK02-01A]|uniref:hypothetical protein n=1 Tax=Streptomyces sp. AK02-01A TaxID=3028648 RepID=UPI0029B0A9FE|nr:hypothetical protein [Streptomyces sp. AK02-01A]MDX3851935.1 hypothetical protein [Streptomyces sp. AK02-01A]